ncbi:MAG: EAL domain-containing protein [Bacilli bacterium]|nr:EAL domain-containing protein [Bacilli bacterium]
MKRDKKLLGLKSLFEKSKIVYFILSFLVLAGAITLTIIGAITHQTIFYVFVLASAYIFFFLLFVFYLLSYNAVYKQFYINMYVNTKNNLKKIYDFNGQLDKYKNDHIFEYQELNNYIDKVNLLFDRSILVTSAPDYKGIPLVYTDPSDKRMVTMESLEQNYRFLILNAEFYRNAFMFFSITSDQVKEIDPDCFHDLLVLLKQNFTEPGTLICEYMERNGYLVYLPYIDSMKRLERRLNNIARDGIYIQHETNDSIILKTRVTLIVYPYSGIEEIFSDLRYALRQSKDVNIYLPDRLNQVSKILYHTTLNLNNIAKIYEKLSNIPHNDQRISHVKKSIFSLMSELANFLQFDVAGYAAIDKLEQRYEVEYEASSVEEGSRFVFQSDGVIGKDFVEGLAKELDGDHTFVFSSSNAVNPEFKDFLDIYGIESGFFFVTFGEKGPYSIIYFLNKGKQKYLDNYSRETLLVFSSNVSQFSRNLLEQERVVRAERRLRLLLRSTNYNMYSIERESHILTQISEGLSEAFGPLVLGEKCYKKFYGMDKPCPDCPLTKEGRKTSLIKQTKYMTSLTLERAHNSDVTLLMTPYMNNDYDFSTNRYDHDLLIHSFFSFKERLDQLFIAKSRGYILLITIDNMDELLNKYGEEGYQVRLRTFFRQYQNDPKVGNAEIYSFRHDMFAFAFIEEGRLDILDKSETIYEIEQKTYDKDDKDEVKILSTFIAFEAPLTYDSSEAFIRNMNQYLAYNYAKRNRSLFVLPASNYEREISKEKFILALIDDALARNALSLKLLPEVKYSTKRITGAEILMRLTDPYRNRAISPLDFIRIAVKTNRISAISHYLIDEVGDMYSSYGKTTFKLAGLTTLGVNMDMSFFEDKQFIDQVQEMLKEYKLPKGFLCFEFTERDFANNLTKLSTYVEMLRSMNITLVIDQYTGKFTSLERVKQYGFTDVKISREIVSQITKDKARLDELSDLIHLIKDMGLKYKLVGVEDKFSAQLIDDIDPEFVAEGYYFYEPLELNDLLEKLKVTIAKMGAF